MPQALDVDYSQAKLIYASTGSLKVASEQTGISYPAIRQRASREEWQTQVTQAAELVSHRVTEALGMARLSMQQRSDKVREGHAAFAEATAERLSQADPDEALMLMDTALKGAKHAQVVFGWQTNVGVNVLTDVLSGDAVTLDDSVIDI